MFKREKRRNTRSTTQLIHGKLTTSLKLLFNESGLEAINTWRVPKHNQSSKRRWKWHEIIRVLRPCVSFQEVDATAQTIWPASSARLYVAYCDAERRRLERRPLPPHKGEGNGRGQVCGWLQWVFHTRYCVDFASPWLIVDSTYICMVTKLQLLSLQWFKYKRTTLNRINWATNVFIQEQRTYRSRCIYQRRNWKVISNFS